MRRPANQSGAIALEAVLLLPLVALLLAAVLGSVRIVTDQLVVTQAARNAARAVGVSGEPAIGRRIVGEDGRSTASVRIRSGVVTVTVRRVSTVLGVSHTVAATASAPLEPGSR